MDVVSPLNDRNYVGVVVRLHQREELPVVEFAVNVERLDFEIKAIDETKKPPHDAAGGVAVSETAIPPACTTCSEGRLV